MKWKNIYIGLMCLCVLNNGMNGALLPIIIGAGPLLLSVFLGSTPKVEAQLYEPGRFDLIDTRSNTGGLLNGGLLGGGLLGGGGNGMLGRLLSVVLMPRNYNYNGPGSVAVNLYHLIRDTGLRIIRLWSTVLANMFSLIRFIVLTVWRGINSLIARIPRALIRGAGRGIFRSGRQRLITLLLGIFGIARPRLRNRLQSGAILAQAASNGALRLRSRLGGMGGGGPLKRILNIMRLGIVNSLKDALRFRLQQFRFTLRQIPRDLISGFRGVKNTAQDTANVFRRVVGRVRSAISRLNNGLLGALVKLPINLLRRILGRVFEMMRNAVRRSISAVAPAPLKHFLSTGPVRRILGALSKLRGFASSITAPAKKVIQAMRNISHNIRNRVRDTLKDVVIAFIVSRAKVPSGLIPRPLKLIGRAMSRVINSGKNLLGALRRVFGEGVIGIVRRALGAFGGRIRNSLPTPRNIIRRLVSRLSGRNRILSRLRNVPTNVLSIISILSNLRARRTAIRINIRRDLMQIRQGLRSIILSAISNFGRGGGIARNIIVRLVTGFTRNRPSVLGSAANIINRVTAVLRGSPQGGLFARFSGLLKGLYYVFEPFLGIG